jgi:transcriptional regulator with XRE-family HTH domain
LYDITVQYDEFTQNRIAQLRTQKNVSARDMSISIGQNKSYINQIENKRALPSLEGLFYICEYFRITPQEFFDDGNDYPERLKELVADLKRLDDKSLAHISGIVKELAEKSQ